MKKLLLLILCLVLAMSVFLTSCNKKDNGGDDNGGATGGENGGNNGGENGGNNGDDACQHVGTLVCENCFESLYKVTAPTLPEINSIGAKVTNLAMTIEDDNDPEKAEDDETITVSMTMIEGYIAIGEDGKLDGYGKVQIAVKPNGSNGTVDACAYIEDNVIYFYDDAYNMNEDAKHDIINLTVNVEEISELQEIKAQLEQAMAMIEEYMPTVEAWLETSLLPIFENVKIDENVSKTAAKTAAKLINSFYKVTKNADGTSTIAFNLDVIKTWNETLSTKKVSEVIDLIAGEGIFAKVEALVNDQKLYDLSVAQVINYLKTEQGVDLVVLLDALDALAKEITGEDEMTFETMVGLNGVDLNTYLTDETILALSVKDALVAAGLGETPDAAVAAFKEMATPILEMLKTKNAYELIMTAAPTEGEAAQDPVQALVAQINGMVDMVSEYFTFTMTADANNNITESNLSVDVAMEGNEITVTVKATPTKTEMSVEVTMFDDVTETSETASVSVVATAEKVTIVYDIDVDPVICDCTMEIIPGHTMTADAEKLAEIKAALADAKAEITLDALYASLLQNYNPYDEYFQPYKDAESGKIYEIDVNSASYRRVEKYDNETGELIGSYEVIDAAYVDIIVYDPTDYFAYSIDGNSIDVIFNAERVTNIHISDVENYNIAALLNGAEMEYYAASARITVAE